LIGWSDATEKHTNPVMPVQRILACVSHSASSRRLHGTLALETTVGMSTAIKSRHENSEKIAYSLSYRCHALILLIR